MFCLVVEDIPHMPPDDAIQDALQRRALRRPPVLVPPRGVVPEGPLHVALHRGAVAVALQRKLFVGMRVDGERVEAQDFGPGRGARLGRAGARGGGMAGQRGCLMGMGVRHIRCQAGGVDENVCRIVG